MVDAIRVKICVIDKIYGPERVLNNLLQIEYCQSDFYNLVNIVGNFTGNMPTSYSKLLTPQTNN